MRDVLGCAGAILVGIVVTPIVLFVGFYLVEYLPITVASQGQLNSSRLTLERYVRDVKNLQKVYWLVGDRVCIYTEAQVPVFKEGELIENSEDATITLSVNGKKKWGRWKKSPMENRVPYPARPYPVYGNVKSCFTTRPWRYKYNILRLARKEGILYSDGYDRVAVLNTQSGEYKSLSIAHAD